MPGTGSLRVAGCRGSPGVSDDLAQIQADHRFLESDARFCAQCGRELPQLALEQEGEAESLRAELARLRAELESVEDAIEIQSFGFYEPRYDFETSQEYLDRLSAILDEQKAVIRDKAATVCPRDWVVVYVVKPIRSTEVLSQEIHLAESRLPRRLCGAMPQPDLGPADADRLTCGGRYGARVAKSGRRASW